MFTEIELKYSLFECRDMATDQQVITKVCDLFNKHGIVFSYQKKQLSNYYFDTRCLALRKQKIALRTRGTQCNNKVEHFEQTIKTSGTVIAGLHQRPEYNVDIDDAKPILALFPANIWQGSTDIAQLQQQIVELFSTNFVRHTWLIDLPNAQVEIAFDHGEIACQGNANKPRIYEVELELISGDEEALFVLTKLLFTQLALRPGQLTKAARGYALFKESLQAEQQISSKPRKIIESTEQISQVMITLPNNSQLNNAFNHGVEFTLTQLQHGIDHYVDKPSLSKLNKICELLILLRQGFWLFSEHLSDDEISLRNELSYFIRTIHWVDNALYIDKLIGKQSSYQKETLAHQELILKLQLTQNRYPSEAKVLAILHSERFNNLQLDLLAMLLRKNDENETNVTTAPSQTLIDFAVKHLSISNQALVTEFTKLEKSENLTMNSTTTEIYLTAHSLLIRALLTTSWFSCLFAEHDNEIIKKFTMPWLDIKQGITELQSLNVLQQQLKHIPQPEQKLSQWLTSKSDNLTTALDQSRAKALTMKPYWR